MLMPQILPFQKHGSAKHALLPRAVLRVRTVCAESHSPLGQHPWTFRQLSIEVCCKGRLYGFMRSCEPATPFMRLLRPRMHPREVVQNRDGQRKPRRKVYFLFDALMQSKDWSETRNIWLRCEEPLTTRITPPTLTLVLLNDRNTIVHGSYCSYPSHFCCTPPRRPRCSRRINFYLSIYLRGLCRYITAHTDEDQP